MVRYGNNNIKSEYKFNCDCKKNGEIIMDKKTKVKGVVVKSIISIIVMGVIIALGYWFLSSVGLTDLSKESLRDAIEQAGAWAPIVFMLLTFLQVTFIPIPSAVTILSGNLLFGVGLTFIYSLAGLVLGSCFAFFLGRVLGRRFVNWIVGDKEQVEKYLKMTKGKEVVIFFFMFLLPAFPDDLLCLIAGITPIGFITFLIIQIICRPIAILGTLFFMSGEVIPYEGWGLAVIAVVAVVAIALFVIAFKNSDKINEKINNFASKIKGEK